MKRIAFCFVLLIPAFSYADICFPSVEEDTVRADVIFVGQLLEISENAFWNPENRLGYDVMFTFQISESFKGLSGDESFLTIFGPGFGCCNVSFELDSTYIVSAYEYGEKSNVYWTNDCSISGLLSVNEKLIELLQPGKTHRIDNDLSRKRNGIRARSFGMADSLTNVIRQDRKAIKRTQQKNRHLRLAVAISVLVALVLGFFLFRKGR